MRKYFLRVFLTTIAIGAIVLGSVYSANYNNNREELAENLLSKFDAVTDDLIDNTYQIIRSMQRLSMQVRVDDSVDNNILVRSFEGLAESRNEIFTLRYLDTAGMEVVRIDRKEGHLVTVPDSLLQDKSHRDYFQENKNLPFLGVSLSNLDLNYEFGEIERPYRLVLRVIVPVHNSKMECIGMLIANIDFNQIARKIDARELQSNQHLVIVAGDGSVYLQDSVHYRDAIADSIVQLSSDYTSQDDSIIITNHAVITHRPGSFIAERFGNKVLSNDPNVRWTKSKTQIFILMPRNIYTWTVHRNLVYVLVLLSFLIGVAAFFSYRWAKFRRTEELTFVELRESNKLLTVYKEELEQAKKKLEHRVADQEVEIDEAQRLVAALFDSSSHFSGIMTPSGTLINVNKVTLDFLGIPKADIIGKKMWDFNVFGEGVDAKSVLQEAIKAVTKGQRVEFETAMQRSDGKLHNIAFSLSPLFNEAGEITHLIPEGLDITDLKEKDRQLQRLVEQLETRNKQLREFSHIVSHNVRSPIGNLGLLLDIYNDAESNEERSEIIQKIHDVNSSLNDMLEELLETVKILDNSEIKLENASISAAVLQAQNLLRRQIETAEVQFDINLEAADTAYYPKVYLNSLLLNLMSNAVKYRSEERRLELRITTQISDTGRVVMEFADNGSGIDMKRNGHKVFGLHKTFHRDRPGKGLGLFMTKTQVESCGGKIQVQSKLNQGTTFIVTFPSSPTT